MTQKTSIESLDRADARLIEALERRRALAKVLPMWPKELDDLTLAGRRHLVAALARALRVERRRGRAGHWTYDLARHAALYRIFKTERRDLDTIAAAASHRCVRAKR